MLHSHELCQYTEEHEALLLIAWYTEPSSRARSTMNHGDFATRCTQATRRTFDYESAAKFLQTRWDLAMIEVEEEERCEEQKRREEEERQQCTAGKDLLAMLSQSTETAQHTKSSACASIAPQTPTEAIHNNGPAPQPQDDKHHITTASITNAKPDICMQPVTSMALLHFGSLPTNLNSVPTAVDGKHMPAPYTGKDISCQQPFKDIARGSTKLVRRGSKNVIGGTPAMAESKLQEQPEASAGRDIRVKDNNYPSLPAATVCVHVTPMMAASLHPNVPATVVATKPCNYISAVLMHGMPTVVTKTRQLHQMSTTTQHRPLTLATENSQKHPMSAKPRPGELGMRTQNSHPHLNNALQNHRAPAMDTKGGQPHPLLTAPSNTMSTMLKAEPPYHLLSVPTNTMSTMLKAGQLQVTEGTNQGAYNHGNTVKKHAVSTRFRRHRNRNKTSQTAAT